MPPFVPPPARPEAAVPPRPEAAMPPRPEAAMLVAAYRVATGALLRLAGAEPFAFEPPPGAEPADAAQQVRLRCWRMGPADGEPWIMLHGLGATAGGLAPVARALAGDCRIVLPELSSFGGSRIPGKILAVEDGLPVIAALIERELGGRPIDVLGRSLGGWMALRLALDRPDLVRRLVLIAPGGYRDQDWERIERSIRVNDRAGARRLVDAMYMRPPLPGPLLRLGYRLAFTSDTVIGCLDRLTEDDVLDDADLARIPVPTALIWGERDGIFDVEVGEKMVRVLPDARLYVVPKAAHVVHWERPRDVVRAVLEFRAATAGRVAAVSAPAAPPPATAP